MDISSSSSSNLGPIPAETTMGFKDWRTQQVQSDSRKTIVNNIMEMETLKQLCPIHGPEVVAEVNKLALNFEEKIFISATSQSDYLQKVTLKMSTMELEGQSIGIDNSLPSASAGSLQNHPGTDFTDALDWQEEKYQKIMKELYLPGLTEMHRSVSIICQKANHVLLEEIREINQHMIDVVVDISDEYIDPNESLRGVKGSEATILQCSFNPPALGQYLKQYAAAQSSVMAFRLLVPPNYPISSPIILSVLPLELCVECRNLSQEARGRCRKSLRELPQPLSLTAIVRTWEGCARAVLVDNVREKGGSFSSGI